MARLILCSALLAGAAFGQVSETAPKFEIADVQAARDGRERIRPASVVRGGRYEIRNATMVDLIRLAYGIDDDKILGGPNWLELDRFDVIAKMPADTGAETQKQMLQALLEDRFKLQIHKETRPLPTYVLTAGKKQLKEGDGTGETGCKPQSVAGPASEGGRRIMMGNPDGTQTTLIMGPGATLRYVCRNVTMAAFAAGLRGMLGASLGANPVLDETGLNGKWNFEVKWSLPVLGPADQAERITVFDALEKQLGLKLEQKPNPTPVLVVDKVNRTPTENPPGVPEALPTPPAPTEFEVADVKPTNPDARTPTRFQMQPGGRLIIQGLPLRYLVGRAFLDYSGERLVGLPGFADSEQFDITALVPAGGLPISDMDLLAPMMRSLLVDQFKMKYHMEERPVSGYSLIAVKPKMKKADPDSRISCKSAIASSPTAPSGAFTLTCRNTSMERLAERLQGLSPVNAPVFEATGLEGGWDFTLTYSQILPTQAIGPGRGGDNNGAPGALPQASDPTGGYTIFEALEKQLGLKLQAQKRPVPVVVIDHIEQKPVD